MSLPWNEQLANDDESQKKWQEFIDKTLKKWLQDPSQLEDDEYDSPTVEIIQLAIEKGRISQEKQIATTGHDCPRCKWRHRLLSNYRWKI